MGTQKLEKLHPCRKHKKRCGTTIMVLRHQEPCQTNHLLSANFATPRNGARLPSGEPRPPQKSSRSWTFPGQCNTLRRRRRPCTRRVSSLHCSLRRGLQSPAPKAQNTGQQTLTRRACACSYIHCARNRCTGRSAAHRAFFVNRFRVFLVFWKAKYVSDTD